MCLTCLDMKHDWTDATKKRRSRLFVYAQVLLFLSRSLNVLFRNLYFMNRILKTKYTLSTEIQRLYWPKYAVAYQSGTWTVAPWISNIRIRIKAAVSWSTCSYQSEKIMFILFIICRSLVSGVSQGKKDKTIPVSWMWTNGFLWKEKRMWCTRACWRFVTWKCKLRTTNPVI